MTKRIEFGCRATAIGSMPHTEASEACRLVLHYLPDIPAWPQLPHRTFNENMYAQFTEGFPGIKIEQERIYFDRSQDYASALEQLYTASDAGDVRNSAISPGYAAGLHAFLALPKKPLAIKGQVTGPISEGLAIADQKGVPIIYDETLREALTKHLRLKAAWQEKTLSQVSPNTIIFVDEPYLATLGTAFVSLSSEQVAESLEEVLGGIAGLKGVHCCGGADWSLLLQTSLNIISFDTYNYADSFSLYPEEVKGLLKKGGAIAWGIVPNDEENLARETIASLKDRLEEAMAPFTRQGISFKQLIEQSLLTPSCALTSLSPEGVEQALATLSGLSTRIRQRYTP